MQQTDDAGSSRLEDARAEEHLEEALEQVVHGAVVSVPSMLVERGLTVVFTAALTNAFTASTFGVFVLARRLQRYLANLALGFRRGLNKFLPNAETDAERDAVATFAAVLLLVVAMVFGAALYVATPAIVTAAASSARFGRFLRVFAVGLPATVWLLTVAELLRALEAVGPYNAVLRVAFPGVQLVAGVVGAVVLGDLVLVAVLVVAATGLLGLGACIWLVHSYGLRPRLRAAGNALRRRYLKFTVPLFFEGFATQTQRLGYYPLVAVFLSGTAGGVFAVGVLVGGLVRLPLAGVNQFISPVAATLHDDGHERALRRLYQVTSRLALVGVVGLAVPVIVYRRSVMAVFGPAFVPHAPLLVGFVAAMVAAATAGSVGFLMPMTDHERALLLVNVVVTLSLAVVAIPATTRGGLPGLVATYLAMVLLNNGLEVLVLYRLEGLQPLTAGHGKTALAVVPFAAVTLGVRHVDPSFAPVIGSVLGVAVYVATLAALGFDPVERKLLRPLLCRYRTLVRTPN